MNKKMNRIAVCVLVVGMLFTQPGFGNMRVSAAQKNKKIALNMKKYDMVQGETVKLKAKVTPINGEKIKWHSSNKRIAQVNANGKVKAKKAGSVKITAQVKGSTKKAVCSIKVQAVPKLKKISLSPARSELKVGETKKITACITPKKYAKSLLKWRSANTKIAVVDEKGKVSGVGQGTTSITAKVRGTKKKTKAVITVKNSINVENEKKSLLENSETKNTNPNEAGSLVNPVESSAAPSAAPSESPRPVEIKKELKAGAMAEVNKLLQLEDNADKDVYYTSSDSNVAVVNMTTGEVLGISAGETVISAVSTDENVLGTCKISVYETGIQISENDTEQELKSALEDDDSRIVKFSTNEKVDITIPNEDYSEKILIVDVPNGEVTNNGIFDAIVIRNVAENTFTENQSNELWILDKKSHVIVGENAESYIHLTNEVKDILIENNGRLAGVTSITDGSVKFTGKSTEQIEFITAGKADVFTSIPLSVQIFETFELHLAEGSEGTELKTNKKSLLPRVSGLGSVSVMIEGETQAYTILADKENGKELPRLDVTGFVRTSIMDDTGSVTEEPAKQKDIYLIPFSSSITNSTISDYYNLESTKKVTTEEDGSYIFEKVEIGNYYIAIDEKGYQLTLQTVVLTSTMGNKFTNDTIVLLEENEEKGGVSGTLYDAVSGDSVPEGITLFIRKNLNNTQGTALASAKTDNQGTYKFKDLRAGVYTIQVVDNRKTDIAYITTHFNVIVYAGKENIGQNTTISSAIKKGQVRFVLSWGDKESGAPADLDAHLIGPRFCGIGTFHTFFDNKNYVGYEKEYNEDATTFWKASPYASIDIDDRQYTGPETTTIYSPTEGVYRFFVQKFSNEDINLSDSKATVTIYVGNQLKATYNVPAEDGNVWYVCNYDAEKGKLNTVNTMSYEKVSDGQNVGSNYQSDSKEYMAARYVEWIRSLNVVDEEAFAKDGEKLEKAIKACRNGESYYDDIKEIYDKMIADIKVDSFKFDGYSSHYTSDYFYDSTYGNENYKTEGTIRAYGDDAMRISVYTEKEPAEDIQVQMKNSETKYRVEAEGGKKYLYVTTSSGLEGKYLLDFKIKNTEIEKQHWKILSALDSKDKLKIWKSDELSSEDPEGEIYLVGKTEQLSDELSVDVPEGSTYEIQEDSGKKIVVTWNGVSVTYDVKYSCDYTSVYLEDSKVKITNLPGDQWIVSKYVYCYGYAEPKGDGLGRWASGSSEDDRIQLFGTAENFEGDLVLDLPQETTYDIKTLSEEEKKIYGVNCVRIITVTNKAENVTKVYPVYYGQTPNQAIITGIIDESNKITSVSCSYNDGRQVVDPEISFPDYCDFVINVKGYNSSLGDKYQYTLFNDDVVVSEKVKSGNKVELYVTYDNYKRHGYLIYEPDPEVVKITGVNDPENTITRFELEENMWQSTIKIYGTNDYLSDKITFTAAEDSVVDAVALKNHENYNGIGTSGTFTVTNDKYGREQKWYVQYCVDPKLVEIEGVTSAGGEKYTCEVDYNRRYSCGYYDDEGNYVDQCVGKIQLYGTDKEFSGDFVPKLPAGATYKIEEHSNYYFLKVTSSDQKIKDYGFLVCYDQDTSTVNIESIKSDSVSFENVNITNESRTSGQIEIRQALNELPKDLKVIFDKKSEGATYNIYYPGDVEWEEKGKSDSSAFIEAINGKVTQTYYIKLYRD